MRFAAIAALSLVLASSFAAAAQHSRRPLPDNNGAPLPIVADGVTVNMQGVLKGISKQEIIVETEPDHSVSLRRTSKTKFFRGEKEVKADDFALDEQISAEVAQDKDAKLMALRVKADVQKKPDTPK